MKAVRLRAVLPPGGATRLEPGRDLLLPDDPAAAGAPAGTLLNDWLDPETRRRAQEDADRAMAGWRARVDPLLTLDGICLPSVYAGHLLTDAFLVVTRIAAALGAFVSSQRPERVELHGADAELTAALAAALDALGVPSDVQEVGPPPRYPIGLARSTRRSALTPVREAIGFPGRPRGPALIQPFRNLAGLWTALPARGVEPVLDPALLPRLPLRELAVRARRGGIIAHPGAVARRRSRARVGRALRSASEPPPRATDPLAALGERRALELLLQIGSHTLALGSVFRAAVGRGLRAAVVPSDTAPYGRTFAMATRGLGGVLVRVQHGFYTDLWRVGGELAPDVDGLEAEHVAVWAPRDAARLRGAARGEISVTGNPGATDVRPRGAGAGSAALVLLQGPSASFLSFDVRASRRYLAESLAGLAAARFSGPVLLRPHPIDPTDYGQVPTLGLQTSVVAGGSIADALRQARLCIATVSTATLEAAAAGVPTVFLDVTGVPLPWPFDGSGALPRATDRESLAEALAHLGTTTEASEAAAREALGARPDALDRVADLVVAATR